MHSRKSITFRLLLGLVLGAGAVAVAGCSAADTAPAAVEVESSRDALVADLAGSSELEAILGNLSSIEAILATSGLGTTERDRLVGHLRAAADDAELEAIVGRELAGGERLIALVRANAREAETLQARMPALAGLSQSDRTAIVVRAADRIQARTIRTMLAAESDPCRDRCTRSYVIEVTASALLAGASFGIGLIGLLVATNNLDNCMAGCSAQQK